MVSTEYHGEGFETASAAKKEKVRRKSGGLGVMRLRLLRGNNLRFRFE